MPKTGRASAADMGMLCPASIQPTKDELLIKPVNPAATVGTVTHKICEHIVENNRIPRHWKRICTDYGLDNAQIADVAALMYAALSFWKEYGKLFEKPLTEHPLKHAWLLDDGNSFVGSGTMDVFEIQGERARILDWKTTRLDLAYTSQMSFYAWLTISEHPEVKQVETTTVYLRDRTRDTQVHDLGRIYDFEERYREKVLNWDGRSFYPGGHCAYCPKWSGCPAQHAMISATQQDLVESGSYLPGDPNSVLTMYGQAVTLERRIKEFKEAVKTEIRQTGPIVGSDQRLDIVESTRKNISAQKAWPILKRELSPEDLDECLKVKNTNTFRFIRANAERGQKTAHQNMIWEELEAAGAITPVPVESLRLLNNKGKENDIGNQERTGETVAEIDAGPPLIDG